MFLGLLFYLFKGDILTSHKNILIWAGHLFHIIIWKENIRIAVAKTEKIIIDAMQIGGIPEDEIRKMIKVCDKSLLEKYAKLTGDEQIIKKIKGLTSC